MLRALSGFERMLLFLGLLLLFVFAAVHVYSAIYSHAALRGFWRSQSSSVSLSVVPSRGNSGSPDFRLWSEKRIEAYRASLVSNFPSPLGILRISSINLEVPVFQGTDDLTLNRGVGHIEGSSSPGNVGNVGIAGHRDGFFRGLKDVHLGDVVDLYTEKGNSRYVVHEIVIVSPEDVTVLAPQSKPALTLVTCYPFYFVGSAPLRYVVHATILNSSNPTNSGQVGAPAEERGGKNSQ